MEWDAALALVGERLAAIRNTHGKDAIAMYYGNPNGHNFGAQIYTQLFIQLLDTQRFFSAGSVDQQPKNLSCGAALRQRVDLSDTPISIAAITSSAWVPTRWYRRAADVGTRRGCTLQGTAGARRTTGGDRPAAHRNRGARHWHLSIRPGTDAFLLLAIVNLLFENERVQPGHLAEHIDGL